MLHRFLFFILFAALLRGQSATPSTTPDVKDPLRRDTPQDAVFQFLEACHAKEYAKAARFLDLRKLPADQRLKAGPDLARQLEDLLDDTPFDIAGLSQEPAGDDDDGLSADQEHLDTFKVGKDTVELKLERIELRPGLKVWLVSADSLPLIPKAHQLVAETPFERSLPQGLVEFEIFDTPVWRWIALLLAAAALWFIAGIVSNGVIAFLKSFVDAPGLRVPLRITFLVAGFHAAMSLAPPSVLGRLYLTRGEAMLSALSLAWMCAVVIDMVGQSWHSRLDPRVEVMSYSVLPLGSQILKLSLFIFAILAVLSTWGYNTSTILAGLGVGGLAVALAAQKTIENLFGGVSVIGDRPVLAGDVCRFGDRTGTVMHIGLRSTRIRTPERTIISVPNAQFSSMPLENISGRDKIFFHPKLNLRRDTSAAQLEKVLDSIRALLKEHPKIESGTIPVRFTGLGSYSLDVDVECYVTTSDNEEFFAIQQDLLIRILKAVEAAGASLAVPLQETYEPKPENLSK